MRKRKISRQSRQPRITVDELVSWGIFVWFLVLAGIVIANQVAS